MSSGAAGAAAMASADAETATAPGARMTMSAEDEVPTSADQLFAYLQSGEYKSFAREAEKHTSVGPHPSPQLQQSSVVLAYFNAPLNESLKEGNGAHPNGSAAVKEFYGEDDQLTGWAVAVKTDDDSGQGQNWYWYEVLSTTDGSNPVAAANGVGLCWGCHQTGRDFVLSRYP